MLFGADLPVSDSGGCLAVSLVGLNYQSVIQALVPLPKHLPLATSLEDLLCGQLPAVVDNEVNTPHRERIETLVQSASGLCQKRMFFVLSIYLVDKEKLEVVINRAYQLDAR